MNEEFPKRRSFVDYIFPALFIITVGIPIILILFAVYIYVDIQLGYIRNRRVSPKSEMHEELDEIRSAIHLHDAQNRPLTGSSLEPLIGRYLQKMPVDPWGAKYLFDGKVGLILSFGADGQSGEARLDEDVYFYYKPPLGICRVQYDGLWGTPKQGCEVILAMTKPFELKDKGTVLDTLQLLTRERHQAEAGGTEAVSVTFAQMNLIGEVSPRWIVGGFGEKDSKPKYHDPENGILSLYNSVNARGENVQKITPTMAINFDVTIIPSVFGAEYGIVETSVEGGPLTTAIYGSDVIKYYRPPAPVPLYNGENRGVKIERF